MVAGEGKGACPDQGPPSSIQSDRFDVVPMTFSLRTQPRSLLTTYQPKPLAGTTSLSPPIILTLNIEPRTPTSTHRALSTTSRPPLFEPLISHLPNH
ncbi:hypothetical protein CPAR01_04832 [Colletotrichum paranaense]|uniref:Uncharacterized protein n=1 Tax=Colletotrichum paranaense TaxID=1914294 RepID=A0ABQ9SXJ7_9PEZI|nr:uncharacterized protein CPAR01_04832 [Colletotrichum paranaense]KAK1544199.1 hypothetical protein CPAR01_04832 [Colletotrichum paranaense]